MNRQIPNDFNKKEFLEKINYIEKVFSKKWLNRNKIKQTTIFQLEIRV